MFFGKILIVKVAQLLLINLAVFATVFEGFGIFLNELRFLSTLCKTLILIFSVRQHADSLLTIMNGFISDCKTDYLITNSKPMFS